MNPRTKEDFDLLYHALESMCIIIISKNRFDCTVCVVWRQDELYRINQSTSGPERKAALCMLLEQEAHLIASIGRHKLVANDKGKEAQIRKFLEAVSILVIKFDHTKYMYSTCSY